MGYNLQSYFWTEDEINAHLERLMVRAFQDLWAFARERGESLRTAALLVAVKRVADALTLSGIYP